ncbi:MAG: DUF4199 domain-containing protein [Muribaculaceae bacterium]|nr:DUF4199 domain-containing protein [Muribaculaceae bacterium]
MIESPYRRGASDGLRFGLYLGAMFFASIFSTLSPILGLVSLALMVSVPAAVYTMMRRYQRSLGVASSFAMLWMYGVVLFFCGMLIAGAALTVYLKWIEPDYIVDQLQTLADMAGTMPGTIVDDAAGVASSMLEARFIPTPISIVVELIMLAIVTGSGLTVCLSALLTFRHRGDTNLKTL